MNEPTTEITDDTIVSSINALATLCGQTYGTIDTLDQLAALLADMVGKPMESVEFLAPQGEVIPGERRAPNILCGHSGCTIKLTKANGRSRVIRFPHTVGEIDARILELARATTEEEDRFEAFKAKLMETLDAYGHLAWTVGNEDWIACADASLGRYDGRLFLAWHVVVDCESGGFTDTIESGLVEIAQGSNSPIGILSGYLDSCIGHYLDEQDGGEPEGGDRYKIDVERCLKSIKEFDQHVRTLWAGDESSIDLDWDDEQEEPFDPVAWGWVGQDGRP
jgi:hypothetical protein